MADATAFTMTLLSERNSQLSIVEMTPVDISCSEPTARTVVEVPAQGEAFYPGVVVDLDDENPTLYVSEEGPHQGEPYFSHRRIDLGGGLEPGGLRVEALVHGQSCEWKLRVRYRDASGKDGEKGLQEVVLSDGDRPFLAEAVPSQPEQYWLTSWVFPGIPVNGDVPNFKPCHEMRNHPVCRSYAAG